MAKLEKVFENPDCSYRGKPFWAWNGKLESGELRRQIRVMKRMGLGGFFMHSRVGLATPYLTDEWFDRVKACVDEARKMDMEAWMYDEDRWPSGAAGGLVTKNPKHALKHLELTLIPKGQFKSKEKPLAVFAADISADKVASNVERLAGTKKPAAGTVLVFNQVLSAKSDWYNGQRYLDTLSHEAVKQFIKIGYEPYAKQIGKDFGKLVPGVFTDEPNYGHVLGGHFTGEPSKFERCYLPWTDKLPAVFKKRYGYDVLDHLPELFFDEADACTSRARYHYYDCITFLFSDAFARQIGEWCGAQGVQFTGHVLAEATTRSQTSVVGAAMRFYEHMQAPGIDILCEGNREYDTAKQCASVAEQMGRRWVLSELYGCTGWQFSFEGHKAVGDWQAALGINLRCQHLAWYTMAGQAKRDYPASIFFQSPWWELYPTVEDYFARVNTLISHGKAVRNLLVVHPIESTWLRTSLTPKAGDEVTEMDRRFMTLRDWLLEAHLDFDYGDEEMLSRLAKVKRAKDAAPALAVGKASYTTVLVPPMLTIRASTLRLLKEFADAGGTVVFCESVAECVDAACSEGARELAAATKTAPFEEYAVTHAVQKTARALSILHTGAMEGTEARKVLYNLRADRDVRYLFICNTDREDGSGPIEIVLNEQLEAEEWDATTGKRWRADFAAADGRVSVRTHLEPCGSACFVFKKACDPALAPRPKAEETLSVEVAPATWHIRLSEPNVLVLDRPEYQLRKKDWQGPEEVLRVDSAVRDALKIPRRGGQMVQPWAREKKVKSPSAPLQLRYAFNAETIPAGELFLAVEQPERLRVSLNGFVIDSDTDCGWWTDLSLRLLPIDPNYLRPGRNVIEISTVFEQESNLEIMFLLGRFGVKVEGTETTLTCPPCELPLGDWVKCGLPFYSGSVTYLTDIERPAGEGRACLSLPDFGGACVRVFVNDQVAGVIGWRPYEVDVTDLLHDGRNRLAIEVFSHRRNSFGPLHHRETVSRWTGPGQFITAEGEWRDDYSLIECGLMAPPALSLRK